MCNTCVQMTQMVFVLVNVEVHDDSVAFFDPPLQGG
jgi:hypothetical protein